MIRTLVRWIGKTLRYYASDPRQLIRPRTNVIATTVDGLRFRCSVENQIERQILEGTFEPDATALVRRLVMPGQTVVDVGANVGYYSLLFSKLVGPAGAVHAFEPTTYARARFRENLALNPGLGSNIHLNQQGLLAAPAERDEAIESQFSQRRPAYSRREHVSFTTVDQYCRAAQIRSLDFVKIDVDGYDQEVVLGGEETLMRYRPLVLCEFCDRVLRDHGTDLATYVELFIRLGYDRLMTGAHDVPRPLTSLLLEPGITDRTVNAVLLPRDDALVNVHGGRQGHTLGRDWREERAREARVGSR